MDRDILNRLRRMAGVPQDFTPVKKVIAEDVIPGMSQILRGGKHKFYLVMDATPNSELGDVVAEVDIQALISIIKGALARHADLKQWELFPHEQQKQAVDLARTRMMQTGSELKEFTIGVGATTASPVNVPEPSQEEVEAAISDDEPVEDENYDAASFKFDDEEADVEDNDQSDDESFYREVANRMRSTAASLVKSEDSRDGKFAQKLRSQANQLDTLADIFATQVSESTDEDFHDDDDEESTTTICPDCEGSGKFRYETHVVDCDRCDGVGEIFESMHYHTDSNYETFADNDDHPVNVDASYDTVWDKKDQKKDDYVPANDTTAVKVPSKITQELERVIREIKAEAEKSKPRDYERAYYYEDTAEALEIVLNHLKSKTVEGLKQAQIYVHRMMNVQRALIPDSVWKFIVDGGTKRSLKAYMNDAKEPVTGKPFTTVKTEDLNKNTHTE